MFTSFEEMPVWKKAKDLAVDIFNMTEDLPRKEDYGLTSQIRRAALSISANIAEAYGRNHLKDKVNFYYHSRGSLSETKSHLIYGCDVGYFEKDRVGDLLGCVDEVWKEINCIIKAIKGNPQPQP